MELGGIWQYNQAGYCKEEEVKKLEEEKCNNSNIEIETRLQQAQAKLCRYINMEESYLKQKATIVSFIDGDCNTKFFQARNTKRIQVKEITKIKDDEKG